MVVRTFGSGWNHGEDHVLIVVHGEVVHVERQHPEEEDRGQSGRPTETEQLADHVDDVAAAQRIEEMVDVVSGEWELGQSVCLLLVGDVEDLVDEEAEHCEDEGGSGGASGHEGEDEEG